MAIASSSSLEALAGASSLARTLPFTCTISRMLSFSRAFSSTTGQGASRTRPSLPKASHRDWAICGAIGDSIRTTASRPSATTARAPALSSFCFCSVLISSITAAIPVLKLFLTPKSSLTFRMVSCTLRRAPFSSLLRSLISPRSAC